MNKKNKLKVICEFQNPSNKALLIELPAALLDALEIDEQGYVDTMEFILTCMAHYQGDEAVGYSLDQLIFDSNIAVAGRKQ